MLAAVGAVGAADWADPDMAAAGQARASAAVEAERAAEEPAARAEAEPELVAQAEVEPAAVGGVYGNPGLGAVAALAVRDLVGSERERGPEAGWEQAAVLAEEGVSAAKEVEQDLEAVWELAGSGAERTRAAGA